MLCERNGEKLTHTYPIVVAKPNNEKLKQTEGRIED